RTDGSVRTVASTGDQAPGTGDGVTFFSVALPCINDNGDTAFVSTLSGPGVNETNNAAFYSESSAVLTLVARSGNGAPGTFLTNFASFLNLSRINNAGKVCLMGKLSGFAVTADTNDLGIWAGSPDNLNLIARTGDGAPNTAFGVVFDDFQSPI